MRTHLIWAWILLLLMNVSIARAECTLAMDITQVIGPANLDFLERGLNEARRRSCSSILLKINTPGGSLETTRLMVERILNSEIPVLCVVAPNGGHAGSAGAILLQACHVSGALPTTNLGAATPVTLQGEMPEDLKKKIFNDTTSWIDALTELRGRNKEFGRELVTLAKAVDAKEALRLKAIDFIADSPELFLEKAKNRTVKMAQGKETSVLIGPLVDFPQDARYEFLSLATHPQVAYLMFMGSLGLLYFELTHPGMIAPGVIGSIGLLISLVSFHLLDVQWGGVGLLVLGLIFLILEMFVPSFGILGIAGIASFVAGSLLLFDPSTGLSVPLVTVLPTAIALGGLLLGLGYLALKAQRRKTHTGAQMIEGEKGAVVVVDSDGKHGQIEILGETWRFQSPIPLVLGQSVRVLSIKGLVCSVEPIEEV